MERESLTVFSAEEMTRYRELADQFAKKSLQPIFKANIPTEICRWFRACSRKLLKLEWPRRRTSRWPVISTASGGDQPTSRVLRRPLFF